MVTRSLDLAILLALWAISVLHAAWCCATGHRRAIVMLFPCERCAPVTRHHRARIERVAEATG